MDNALKTALAQPDADDALLAAVDHADVTMRKYIWRGSQPKGVAPNRELTVGDKSASDFVNEALRRLCDGTRSYNPQRSLLENLNSITDSLIWTEKKASDRTKIVDNDMSESDHGAEPRRDPVVKNPTEPAADTVLLEREKLETQTQCFRLVKAAFDGDKETQEYLEALSQGFFDIQDISELTGITPEKIYEIRRKLKNFAPTFFGVADYKEMQRKINEGT